MKLYLSAYYLLLIYLSCAPTTFSRIVHLAKNENENNNTSSKKVLRCPEEESSQRKISGIILLVLGALGCITNLLVLILIVSHKRLRRWGLGLIFHQCCVDLARAVILFPLGCSLLQCQPIHKCSLLETAFLLLATVSTVGNQSSILFY